MVPTPGGVLDQLNQVLTDPQTVILAHLAKGPIDNLSAPVDLGTLVEADFPGYAALPVVPNLDDGWENDTYGEYSPLELLWTVGAGATPQFITHVYYTGTYAGGAPILLSAIPFPNPLLVTKEGEEIRLDATVGAVAAPEV